MRQKLIDVARQKYLALNREESCGGHFREEYQTEEGEAKRNDSKYCYVSAWEYKGENQKPIEHKEELVYENIKLAERSYK
jgi:succinate dehydrogenase / fumarate reductase flavoprotein subunit